MSTISLKQALIYGINELRKAGIDSARLDAELLLGFVLHFNQEKIISNPKFKISNLKFKIFKNLISKRSKHYPIAYLTNHKEFYGLDFYINENVLVPRPETELLVEEVLRFVGTRHALSLLEIGTGSGCIALTLAKYLPQAKITASDISQKALVVACGNRRKLKIKNVKLLKSNLLEKVKTNPDIIVANLPYLTRKELNQKSIIREPKLALYGGKAGMEIYEKLFQQIHKKQWKNMTLFLEIGETQGKKIKNLVKKYFPYLIMETKKDLAMKERVVIIRQKS